MNRLVLLVGGLITIPLLVFLALGFGHDPNVIESPLIGKPAPAFALKGFEEGALSSADLAGKPAVINFWASWCRPCVFEHPHLVAAARDYAGRVAFVGIVPAEDTVEAVGAFERQLGRWSPALWDRDGKVSIAYGVFKLPETYVIDSSGVILKKYAGPIEPDDLRRTLDGLL